MVQRREMFADGAEDAVLTDPAIGLHRSGFPLLGCLAALAEDDGKEAVMAEAEFSVDECVVCGRLAVIFVGQCLDCMVGRWRGEVSNDTTEALERAYATAERRLRPEDRYGAGM